MLFLIPIRTLAYLTRTRSGRHTLLDGTGPGSSEKAAHMSKCTALANYLFLTNSSVVISNMAIVYLKIENGPKFKYFLYLPKMLEFEI